MRRIIVLLACLLLAPKPDTCAEEPSIPFPSALKAAAVVQNRLDDIGRQSLVLGNGDLNALLWADNGLLRMRVTKNDLWDARIDTSRDPDLLSMDIQKRTWRGGTRTPPSWHDHPYPQPRCAAVVVIGQAQQGAACWKCVRRSDRNDWRGLQGHAVMSVSGTPGASAGYRLALPASTTPAYASIRIRLSGTPNARHYVNVIDSAGQDLARSGWHETPGKAEEISFEFSVKQAPAALELYIMTEDGKPAENRYGLIAFEGDSGRRELDLAPNTALAGIPSRLDLQRAVATIEMPGKIRTTVRALAHRNVFLIHSPEAVSLEQVKAPHLPAARLGKTGGVKWLHMKMPGDLDYPGMAYALAVAGKDECKAVSMMTSFDTSGNVLDGAIRLARETINADPVTLIAEHEKGWGNFWSASGVKLGDSFFQDAWYRNLYYMRCFCRPGTSMPITLYAGLAQDRTGWHGAPTLDYNFQQTFWPSLVCNHVDLMEPYVAMLEAFAPRGRWLARKTYGLDGLFYPVNIFGPEHRVAPEGARSKNARQIAYVPWSYGLGLTGWALQNVWLRYKFQPDRGYLARVYPLLRDGAEFYANVMAQCRDDADGKAEIGPSYNPEHGPFGTFNNPVDITYFRFLLDAAGEAARLLGRDEKLAERWRFQLSRIPDYETTPFEGKPIVANWTGATAASVKVHNVAVPTVPIFPGNQVCWFSPARQKRLFERTLRWIRHNGNNSHIMVNVARARLSFPEAYTKTRAHFSKIATPNGLYASWPGHGYFLAESWAFAGLASEFLLQSVQDIIRVFPAWPDDQDAAFVNLRAQGGFLVTAEQAGGKVRYVKVKSTVGGRLQLVSPWPAIRVRRKGGLETLETDQRGIASLHTEPGEELRFAEKH